MLFDLSRNGYQSQQIIAFAAHLVPNQWLPPGSTDKISPAIFQSVLQGIWFTNICCNSGWEGTVSCFNRGVSVMNSNDYKNPHFFCKFLFFWLVKEVLLFQPEGFLRGVCERGKSKSAPAELGHFLKMGVLIPWIISIA